MWNCRQQTHDQDKVYRIKGKTERVLGARLPEAEEEPQQRIRKKGPQ